MIDWMAVRRAKRIKIVRISEEDVENYLLISKLPDAKAISTFNLPKQWVVAGVSYEPQHRTFAFVVMSPEFEKVPVGMMPQVITETRHVIEITRKAVST